MLALLFLTLTFITIITVGAKLVKNRATPVRSGVLLSAVSVAVVCFYSISTDIKQVVEVHSSIKTLFSNGYRREMLAAQITELRRVQDSIDNLAAKYGVNVSIHIKDGLFIRSLIAQGGNLTGSGEAELANAKKLEMFINRQNILANQINEKIEQAYGQEFNDLNKELLRLENDPFSGLIVRYYRKHFITSEYIYTDNLRLN
jgi:hypothetical protein